MNEILLILAVGGIAFAGSVLFRSGNLADMLRKIQQVQSDTASAVADNVQNTVDTAQVAVETVKAALWTPPARAAPYLSMIDAATTQYGLPPLLLARILWQESHFRDDIISGQVRSKAGALGIAQFLPATAAELGIDPLNPRQAIPGAARYLATLKRQLGSWPDAIAAYDWGIGNVQRIGLAGAPKETTDYVTGVLLDIALT